MNSLLAKRLANIVISIVAGFIILYLEVSILPDPVGLQTTLGDYGFVYIVTTWLCLALGIGCVLDKFMGTKFLPG